ncbi:TPR-like protein [Umbelopsis sp. AD052]|nr:TPR-like protein [Umbelopsis sp. AD052]
MARLDFEATSLELQQYRQSGERASERVAYLASRIIKDGYSAKLQDDIWPFYEQAVAAALDVGDFRLADECIENLKRRFSNSSRVQRLVGMRYEAEGKLAEAQKIYDAILEEDESNILVSKRQIALLKLRGLKSEAIAALVSYLDTYYSDAEAWIELCSLYLSVHAYQKAAYCLEELILLQAANPIWHLKYAEIMYTLGDYSLALKQYCRVIDLHEDHLRGMYGIQLCASKIMANGEADDTTKALKELATERILATEVDQCTIDSIKQVVREYLSVA